MSIKQVKVGSTNHNLIASNVAYGTCATAAATAAKVVTVSGGWELTPGAIVSIKFTYTNTAQNPTLNVNGTGAKKVWYSTALITTGSLSYAGYANRIAQYMYDGTQYVFQGWSYDSNSDAKTASGSSTDTKLFLIGAAAQSTSGQTTKSNANCYIGTDNCLYSGGAKVLATGDVNKSASFTLAAASWASGSGITGFPYKYTLSVTGMTATAVVNTVLDPASVALAAECGMCSSCDSAAGTVTFYSRTAPSSALTGTLYYT